MSLKLSDGLVLGTDSAVTVQLPVPGPGGQVLVVSKVFTGSQKLFALGPWMGAMSYGLGDLGEGAASRALSKSSAKGTLRARESPLT